MKIFRAVCLVIVFSVALSRVHAQETPTQQGDPIIAEVLGKKIMLSQKDKLDGIIFGTLLEQYAKEHKIEPSRAEIEAFVAKSKEREVQHRKEWNKEKKDLLKKLKSKTLSKSEKDQLTSSLETLNSLLEVDPEMEKYEKENPKEIKKMEEEMANRFIHGWKVNKALFKQYGGRVIFQQAGAEPLDAYRNFLKEQEKKRSFQILDKKYEVSFWRYFTNDAMHTFYPKDEGAKFINTPWWMMEEPQEE